MEVVTNLENPIRIKITGQCNRKCFFCHQEGGMNIDTINFSKELKEMIELLSSELHMKSVAITGGEPLLHDDLVSFMSKIMKCQGMKRFSITTNGTISKPEKFWRILHQEGLYKVNISMPDILLGNTQNLINAKWSINSDNIFQNQKQMIQILNSLGVEVKVNIAIINDEFYTMSVLEQLMKLKDLSFEIVLLPNITKERTFSYSQLIIKNIIKIMELKLISIRQRKATSNAIYIYQNDEGRKIQIKTTKLNTVTQKLNTICQNCPLNDKCQEGFYGIRVEQIKGVLYVRLCIHRSSEEVLIPFESFIKSPAFYELKELWGKE